MTTAGEDRLDARAGHDAENDWITLAQGGDPVAWNRLVRDHQEHIFRLAYLVLRDAAEAEDVAQETFVRAYLTLNRFEVGRPLRPWLTRIAVNLARNRRRALGRYVNHLRRLLTERVDPVRETAGPEKTAQARWQASRLSAAVGRLNRDGQEVIYLRYFLDMAEADMAEALDVRPGTIKSRLYRARQSLRQVIEDDYPELGELFR